MDGFTKKLAEIDRLIDAFYLLSKDFPTPAYGDIIFKLKKDRAELTSKIGRK